MLNKRWKSNKFRRIAWISLNADVEWKEPFRINVKKLKNKNRRVRHQNHWNLKWLNYEVGRNTSERFCFKTFKINFFSWKILIGLVSENFERNYNLIGVKRTLAVIRFRKLEKRVRNSLRGFRFYQKTALKRQFAKLYFYKTAGVSSKEFAKHNSRFRR